MSAVAAPSAALRSFEAQWRARAAGPLAALRGQAMQRLLALGLPSSRDESWRYTSLRALAAQTFVEAPRIADAATLRALPQSWLAGAAATAPIVIVNGYPDLAHAARDAPRGVEISSLLAFAEDHAAALLGRMAPQGDAEQTRWALLNTALFADGLYLRIHAAAAAPVLIVHVAAGGAANATVHSRVIIEAMPGCAATIIEHHIGAGAQPALCNSTTQILLAAESAVEHYRVIATPAGTTHFDSLDIRQARASRCRQFTIVLGGGLVRTNLDAHLEEAGALHEAYALLAGHEARHVDCVATAVHAAPGTKSRQTARAIAGGTSRVIFNSKVIVEQGAAGADSLQSSRGLLLAPTAEIDTRPQLEIHADDVKCAHGATIGRLDADMLFYLLSRGLDLATAQGLLVYAFLDDVLTGMSSAQARARIEDALIAQLPDAELLRSFR
ncbi:MAG TPA: Fe-S cluster assembly protein SufD [Steroidobacteraceae bacterium]|nr:Fe-S cluster assembly protein SufD [Steroidobacteraceae bacterium]